MQIVKRIFSFLPEIWDNSLSIFGAGLTTASAIVIITVFLLDWTGFHSNPYMGIIVFLIMPTLFFLGLILIPVGKFLWHGRKVQLKSEGESPFLIRMNLADPRFQRQALTVLGFSLLNILIVMAVSYQAVTFMDSNEFCGKLCHTVMIPEYTSYQNSPHSRVHCVNCHIGTGASWFVKYKLSGLRQVWAVMVNSYPRPIPAPVENLRPARETCEQCHWPEKFTEDRVRVMRKYGDDENNSATYTVLLMKIGGSNSITGKAHGIHWHTGRNNRVEYIAADRQRQTIPWVRLTDEKGTVTEYAVTGADITPAKIAAADVRLMDCVDCHNRPTHIYQLPERALDHAFADGLIDSSLPNVRKLSLAALKKEYSDKETAIREIGTAIASYYQKEYPELWKVRQASVEGSAAQIQAIYDKNVFPQMRVTWGTYSNNIGHNDFPGCFRCHDDKHKSASGKTISQDCDTCHSLLAVEESKPTLIPEIFSKK